MTSSIRYCLIGTKPYSSLINCTGVKTICAQDRNGNQCVAVRIDIVMGVAGSNIHGNRHTVTAGWNSIAPMSQLPTRVCPSWSVGGQASLLPASIAGAAWQ
jgi:hypothetical protein